MRPGSRAALLATFAAVISIITFLAPFPTKLTELGAIKAAWFGSGIAVTGHSVITHVSKCDADRRTIPQILGADAGSREVDLSYPGQPLFEGLNFARLALHNPRISHLVVMISLPQVQEAALPDLRDQAFFPAYGRPVLRQRYAQPPH